MSTLNLGILQCSLVHLTARPLSIRGLSSFLSRLAAGSFVMRSQKLWFLFLATLFRVEAEHAILSTEKSLNTRELGILLQRDLPIGTCNSDTPCPNGACCGSNGLCGYSPTECGSGCTSNCNAKAQCGQYGTPGQQNCPLNVCCSQFGWVFSTFTLVVE